MENGNFLVSGWNPSATFNVYAGAGDVPPVMGTQEVSSGQLIFKPRFPIAPGVTVRAVLHEPGKSAREVIFEIPRRAALPATQIVQVYPSLDALPANQLKLYIEFSASMARGEAWRRIHLLDDKGVRVEVPFLEIEQELWDPDGKRLTILFDPGRIKRGLQSLEEEGPALEEGRSYTLLIDSEWRDASGTPLGRPYRKQFRVGASDRVPPSIETWRVVAPAAGTRAPLVVKFPEPMDYALLLRLLNVHSGGRSLDGVVSIGSKEMEWRFTPLESWQPGEHRLIADTWLEDLAGNRLGRAFDLDVFEKVTSRVERKTVSLRFRIRNQ